MKTKMSVLDAKNEAQKIAFGPIVFQATIAMRDLGILRVLGEHRKGLTIPAIARELRLSEYGVSTLLEMASCAGIVDYAEDGTVALTAVGYILKTDAMTAVNMNFVNDVCYDGAKFTTESIRSGKPEGLRVFGEWPTVYQGLSQLPEKVRASWFAFDHFYSDAAFPAALKVVFADKPGVLFDIGGNTGKWALACCAYDPHVRIRILDLPGQLAVAQRNAQEQGVANRIDFQGIDLLDQTQKIPRGADVIWMSQFLDCFSPSEIVHILRNVHQAASDDTAIYILEPFIDTQRYAAAAYCLAGTSLYFTTMANGNSKIYASNAMLGLVEEASLKIEATYPLIENSHHTILRCRRA